MLSGLFLFCGEFRVFGLEKEAVIVASSRPVGLQGAKNRRGAVERKGREGRKEILSYFASFATSAFDRDVVQARPSDASAGSYERDPIVSRLVGGSRRRTCGGARQTRSRCRDSLVGIHESCLIWPGR